MSRVLIDTQALIWFAENSSFISAAALALVDDPATERLTSVASLWEMGIKTAIGRLTLKTGTLRKFAMLLEENAIRVLPILPDEAIDVASLPAFNHHKDPFDRLIAAQCLRYDLTLVSVDRAFDAYGVRRVW